VGAVPLDSDWNEFYPCASTSQSLKLVKTHKYPRDDQPSIYICRDGRMAVQSYLAFHRSFIERGAQKTLLSLIVGDNYYGSWSDHYRTWTTRTAPTLVVHFEDLVVAKPELIQKIGRFIGRDPIRLDWLNPMNELQQQNPDFFRSGLTNWQPLSEWTYEINQIFNYFHGNLMIELGYFSKEVVDTAISEFSFSKREFLDITERLSKRCASLQFHCEERLRVIHELKQAADDRLELINILDKKLERRL